MPQGLGSTSRGLLTASRRLWIPQDASESRCVLFRLQQISHRHRFSLLRWPHRSWTFLGWDFRGNLADLGRGLDKRDNHVRAAVTSRTLPFETVVDWWSGVCENTRPIFSRKLMSVHRNIHSIHIFVDNKFVYYIRTYVDYSSRCSIFIYIFQFKYIIIVWSQRDFITDCTWTHTLGPCNNNMCITY